jgi:hypothetical protein
MHRALQGRCGNFCGNCEIYIAYSTGNKKAQRRIAAEYFGESITPDEVKCLGCRGNINNVWRGGCKIRFCAEDKGVEFCYQCNDYPCKELATYFADHPRARENLRQISKIGPDAWLHNMLTKEK